MRDEVLALCLAAFPNPDHRDSNYLIWGRKNVGQALQALTSLEPMKTEQYGELARRAGNFLREDGRYQEAGPLLETAKRIFVDICGQEGFATLRRRWI